MIRIINTSFALLAELNPIYLEWVRRYYKPDYFTMKIPWSEYLVVGNYVLFENRVGVITKTTDTGDMIEVSGSEYGFAVNKRIVEPSEQTGAGETLQKYYVTANCITPTARKILNFSVESDQQRGSTITMPARYQDVETIMTDIYMRTGLGWCVEYNSGNFIFTTIQGSDRSNSQTNYPRVVFSEDYGNLFNVTLIKSIQKYYNVAYMGGQGTGGARVVEVVGTDTQNDRYEIFVDAKNLDTTAKLQAKGNEVLAGYNEEYQIDATFKSTGSLTYNTDYFLGDIVTIKHRDVTLDLRLIEVKKTVDTEETLDFVFGREPVTLANAINKRIELINSEVYI